jgi:hypothetical protein
MVMWWSLGSFPLASQVLEIVERLVSPARRSGRLRSGREASLDQLGEIVWPRQKPEIGAKIAGFPSAEWRLADRLYRLPHPGHAVLSKAGLQPLPPLPGKPALHLWQAVPVCGFVPKLDCLLDFVGF